MENSLRGPRSANARVRHLGENGNWNCENLHMLLEYFTGNAVQVWNSLPLEIVREPSLDIFNYRVTAYYLS